MVLFVGYCPLDRGWVVDVEHVIRGSEEAVTRVEEHEIVVIVGVVVEAEDVSVHCK